MRKRLAYILALLPLAALGQTTTQNFVKTTAYRGAGSTLPAVQVTYLDGLGRPIQQVAQGQSASGKDIVTHIEYDSLGRQRKEFLPYSTETATGGYRTDAATKVLSYYGSPTLALTGNPDFEPTGNPYSEKLFEASPVSRVLKQAAPGNPWAMGGGKEIRFDYLSNSDEEVRLLRAVATWDEGKGLYTEEIENTGAFYAAGELFKSIVRNENWTSGTENTTEEFKDKQGRVILKRTYGESIENENLANTAHDTYYLYDQYGNLAFVLSPKADPQNPQASLEHLSYQYLYDSRNRVVEKKLPGKNWEYIVYNRMGQIAAAGPAGSPFDDIAGDGWLVTKYDAFGRIAYTGWYQNSNYYEMSNKGRISMQGEYDTAADVWEARNSGSTVGGIAFNYTNGSFPQSSYHVLTVNYYDDYSFPNPPASFAPVEGQTVYYDNSTRKPKGMPTGSWVRVLQASTDYLGQPSYVLYDYKGRAIQQRTGNYLGGFHQASTLLDFSGKTLKSVTAHARTGTAAEYTITEDFGYSAQDRLISHTHKLNSKPVEMLSLRAYDELGQLILKDVGRSSLMPLQTVNYSYNVRGWLKEINKTAGLSLDPGLGLPDLFAFRINYDAVGNDLEGEIKGLYNGNISETLWLSANDNTLRSYGYKYDGLNRLREAVYQKGGARTNSYNEEMRYDKNGNIADLKRNGDFDQPTPNIMIDDLQYAYDSGNRLLAVRDHTAHPAGFDNGANGPEEYGYDDKGNMVRDDNKGITQIVYNHLNLPKAIYFAAGTKITYLYDALGTKLGKTVTEPTEEVRTDYLNGFQYEDEGTRFFATAEGYVNFMPNRGGYTTNYVYNYTDHLGNVRLSYSYTSAGLKILEENNYYPYGLKHEKYNSDTYQTVSTENGSYDSGVAVVQAQRLNYRYKYNGQEFQDELGLNMYDMNFRDYDPAIGRWTGIDPVIHHSLSTYNAFDGNPVFWADPSGADAQQTGAALSFEGVDIAGIFNAILSFLDTGYGSYTIQGEYSEASGPDGKFTSIDGAALDFAVLYNGVSIINKVELGSAIYSLGGYYSYTTPTGSLYKYKNGEVKGNAYGIGFGINDVPIDAMLEGFVHTHANYENPSDNNLSSMDKEPASEGLIFRGKSVKVPVYLVTPSGELMVRDVYRGNDGPKMRPTNVNIGNLLIPNDPKSPVRIRKNQISPIVIPPCAPTIWGTNGYPIDVKYK